ncbi:MULTISPECIES: molybdopterin converting factor subunit 1 [Planococcus]|uniref:Molybdopterin synthase sulfur carrier subunit n=1 Tax=Planococcus faecalis TaxID=1598147 RepID=A0ABN4XI77_9BACL|nr:MULTISPECIES: molybdopterin converting factor subunit 1 [Planococcus]AQU79376.1 molybdopterin converting factor subunit 1 [Planococcus faecalis]KAA0956525.1 molybdopterin converting factor subunit 1 [Planococcus sp. ANT_H30]MDJ0333396.1 molybdopterin converting factor subunit 1 [Planococcus sp. S3-L1]OHX51891.1 molybdopterin converting factor subunit 1 [Planococcus faecalis]
MITLCYFAGLKEQTGVSEEQVDMAGQTVDDLWQWATTKYPEFLSGAARLAVNEEYALPTDVLERGDVVAFIPPVSGG